MKSIATPWRSTPLTGFRDCKKSGPTPRRNSVTNRSNAVPTHTRMASITRTLRDGGGRTGRNKLALTKMQRRKDVVCTLKRHTNVARDWSYQGPCQAQPLVAEKVR